MFRGKLLEEADMRVRVWKLVEKTMYKLTSLQAQVCKKDFQLSKYSPETFIWKVKNSVCPAIVCPASLFGNIWIIIGIYHSPRCFIFPTCGQLYAHKWELKVIYSFSNNCNQPPGFQ